MSDNISTLEKALLPDYIWSRKNHFGAAAEIPMSLKTNAYWRSFYRTRVRSLAMLVTHRLTDSLTNSLTDSRLVNLIDVTLACDDGNSKLTNWLTHSLSDSCLVDLMMRIVSATVCCKFGNWGMVIKINFCSDFEHKVWRSRLWSWSSGKICMVKKIFYVGKKNW